MAYQDHLTRQIEQLGMVLRRLLTGLLGPQDPGEMARSAEEVERALEEALGLVPGALIALEPDQLIAALHALPAASEANLDLLADLLVGLADAPGCEPPEAIRLDRQALALLEHLNTTSNTFDMDRHAKMARLRSRV